MIGVQASYPVGVPKTEPGGTASTASASNHLVSDHLVTPLGSNVMLGSQLGNSVGD